MKRTVRDGPVSTGSELGAIISRLQRQTKSRKQVKEEIEWAKAGTRKAVAKTLKA